MDLARTMHRLLFVVSEDWYFWSHRLSLARAARAAGYEVALATRSSRYAQAIESEGIRLIPLAHLNRGSTNPAREILALAELVRAYRWYRPFIVHHVAIKPVIYGAMAARITRVPIVVNALGGLGYTFLSQTVAARLLRPFVFSALRFGLNSPRGALIVQNSDDARTILDSRLVADQRLTVIRGSGVDIEIFKPTPESGRVPIVVLPARMLWDKGVGEFAAAARILRGRGVRARFALVGQPDRHNPRAVPRSQLEAWAREGVVEWWGLRQDMPEVFAAAHIVCLPTYYEGLPKALLEAAACARPIVATDIPGCREIARAGVNALLAPVRDAQSLAAALERLILDPALRQELGAAGRRIVEHEFTQQAVADQTLALYGRLATPWASTQAVAP
jgi:glycosyltransferase involved in cell wall biosynthesis